MTVKQRYLCGFAVAGAVAFIASIAPRAQQPAAPSVQQPMPPIRGGGPGGELLARRAAP